MKLRALALALAVAAVLLFAAAGPGTRLGLWHFRTGFQLLRWGAYLGGAGIVVSLAALAVARRRGGFATPLVALALSAVAFGVPWSQMRRARAVPPIHDITTDTQDPPPSSPCSRSAPARRIRRPTAATASRQSSAPATPTSARSS